MVDDFNAPSRDTIALTLEDAWGEVVTSASRPYQLSALGQMTYRLDLPMPQSAGEFTSNPQEAARVLQEDKVGGQFDSKE